MTHVANPFDVNQLLWRTTDDVRRLLFQRYKVEMWSTHCISLWDRPPGAAATADQQRKMIGVKRPFKLGAPKPPKSAKKKKLLKETKPIPDPDDATVITNPHTEPMVQKPSDLMEEITPPFTEVVDEGYMAQIEESVNCTPVDFEPCDKLPHKMRFRYRMLLKQSNPQKDGDNPSLTYLEDKYGHLVEKEFWYNRVFKLASAYRENCQGDVCDLSHTALEEAVGHLVPLTVNEQEYLQLMEHYNKSNVKIDGIPTLEFLRQHYANPHAESMVQKPSETTQKPDC